MEHSVDLVLYVHGQGGSAAESDHYRPLFPGREVLGLDYRAHTPWEAVAEIWAAAERLKHRRITLIANSIGAFFCMTADIGAWIGRAYFISPLVDMEKLITDRMAQVGVTEADLEARGVIPTPWGEELSWAYLCYVRSHPVQWDVPTAILYGGRDHLTAYETVSGFAQRHRAHLTVMENGEHWFHTEEQMRFLDHWIVDLEAECHAARTASASSLI